MTDQQTALRQQDIVFQIQRLLEQSNLESLTDEQLRQVIQGVWYDSLKDELRDQVRKSRVDITLRVQEWLNTLVSPHTKKAYQRATRHFLDYLNRKGIHPLEVKAREVDNYIAFLHTESMSLNTQRLYISACSAFYSCLERFDDVSRNYFRGARLPKRQRYIKTANEIPDTEAVTTITTELQREMALTSGRGYHQKVRQARYLAAVVHLIIQYGFRVGALTRLSIDAYGHYTTISKEHQLAGTLSAETLLLLETCGLSCKRPFGGYKTNSIQRAFARFCHRLYQRGLITTIYSLHDLRHYFAVQEYCKNRDILALRNRLGHASVAVTEIYLSSFNVKGLQNR